jgi:hypothetical protein
LGWVRYWVKGEGERGRVRGGKKKWKDKGKGSLQMGWVRCGVGFVEGAWVVWVLTACDDHVDPFVAGVAVCCLSVI